MYVCVPTAREVNGMMMMMTGRGRDNKNDDGRKRRRMNGHTTTAAGKTDWRLGGRCATDRNVQTATAAAFYMAFATFAHLFNAVSNFVQICTY